MSATDLTTNKTSTPVTTSLSSPSVRSTAGVASWFRVLLVCAILLGSAGVRAWQTRRIEAGLAEGRHKPRIDLAQIPMTLGPWIGETTKIDAQIARGTGADQIVTRRYVNQNTGVAIEIILLYGPAVDVYLHSPEVCYPAAGYTQVGGSDERLISTLNGKAPFRSLVYARGEETQAESQEVYYCWWYNGRWTPDVGKQKHFERIPSMYKVHLARRVSERELRDVGNPCEALLQELLPEMERRMLAAQPPPS
ncbi:MAG: hypothetical protein NVSMB9_04380 [Isosphaeraceae bacterium]